MSLTIYKASAGSGKTYKITEEYLTLLFRKPYVFKNILAVTFTNKATGEMKNRILKELSDLSNNRPSPYLSSLQLQFNKSEKQIREQAKDILKQILHDYSRFSVETIDRFFQRILRSFVKEMNLQGTFSIELDRERVLEEAIENLLLTVDDDVQLKKWLINFVNERIEKGKSWNLKSAVYQLAREIFNEKFQVLGKSVSEKLNDKDFLEKYVDAMYSIKHGFELKMSDLGQQGLALMKEYDLEIDDFYYKKSGVAGYFVKLAEKKDFDPKIRAREAIGNIDKWCSEKAVKKERIEEACDKGLYNLLSGAVEYYDKNYLDYNTANAILKNVYTLGIITDISKQVRSLCEDENIFLLSDAGPFISSIIEDSDTPFMYEKAGSRFYHYMLDEFQDTSYVQWNNFKPLITDSLAAGYKNIVVGDVKQSIYRWRNSSWKILSSEVHAAMAAFEPTHVTLESNWRSSPELVKFNNTLFQNAATYLQQLFNAQLPENEIPTNELTALIEKAYEKSVQKITKSIHGTVELQFLAAEDDEVEWYDLALEAIPARITYLQACGVMFSEIAILVRNQKEGAMIADYLMDYNQVSENQEIQFISTDALRLQNSVLVKMVINTFRYLLHPEDTLNLFELVFHYKQCIDGQENFEFHKYQRDTLEQMLPVEFRNKTKELIHLPLPNLFEKVVAHFKLNHPPATEMAYLYAFGDLIRDYSTRNNHGLSAFLDWWDQNGTTQVITTTGEQNAVSIVTIHKSKGLEFRAVLVPFCDWDIDHNPSQDNILWCNSTVSPFNELELLPVRYGKDLIQTHFKDDYFEEKIQAFVDNLNLLYVAFTRAKQFLYVYSPDPEAEARKDKTIARLLLDVMYMDRNTGLDENTISLSKYWNSETKHLKLGQPKPSEKKKQVPTGFILSNYTTRSQTMNYLYSRKSAQWFRNDGQKGIGSVVDEGKIMHRIFENILVPADVDEAVEKVIREKVVSEQYIVKLKQKIQGWLRAPEVSKWFEPKFNIKREASILLPDGTMRRPDRVIVNDDGVLVIDFKFGLHEKSSDISQMRDYMKLFQSMGYENIWGFIWYAEQGAIKEVELS